MRSTFPTAALLIGLHALGADSEGYVRTAIKAIGVPRGVPSVSLQSLLNLLL